MDRRYCIHKTLKQPTHLINIVFGNWFGDKNSDHSFALFNFFTNFKIFHVTMKNEQVESRGYLYCQQFMSRVFYICKGPELHNFDTFFALRQSDIMHFHYDPSEHFFTAVNLYKIPSLSINPTNLFFTDPILTISCNHGTITAISHESHQVIQCQKKCGSVLACFQNADGTISRIESGENLVTYNEKTLEIISSHNVSIDDFYLYNAFPFNNNVILCYTNRLNPIQTNENNENEEEDKNETTCIFKVINKQNGTTKDINCLNDLERKIVSYAHFSPNCVAILLDNNEVYSLSQVKAYKLVKIEFQRPESIYKLLPFHNNLVICLPISSDSFLISPQNTQKYIPFLTNIGQFSLSISAPPTQIPTMTTFANTNFCHRIGQLKQGLKTLTFDDRAIELNDYCSGVYSISLFNRRVVFANCGNSCKVFEYTKTGELQEIEFHSIKENMKTKGVGAIYANNNYLVHAKSDGVSLIQFNNEGLEVVSSHPKNLFDDGSVTVTHFASTPKQIAVCIGRNKISYQEVSDNSMTFNANTIDIGFDITAVCFSSFKPENRHKKNEEKEEPQQKGIDKSQYADTLAVAIIDHQTKKSKLLFYQSLPFENQIKDELEVMNPICSVQGITHDHFCVGLENGLLLIVKYAKGGKNPQMINSIQTGKTRCYLSKIDRNTVIAHGTKTWRIGVNQSGLITILPFATHSFSYIAPLSPTTFLGCVGKTFQIISDNKTNDLSFTRFDLPEKIISISSIIDTSILFIATEKCIKFLDLNGATVTLDKKDSKTYCEDDEFIVDMSISDNFLVNITNSSLHYTQQNSSQYVQKAIPPKDSPIRSISQHTIPHSASQILSPPKNPALPATPIQQNTNNLIKPGTTIQPGSPMRVPPTQHPPPPAIQQAVVRPPVVTNAPTAQIPNHPIIQQTVRVPTQTAQSLRATPQQNQTKEIHYFLLALLKKNNEQTIVRIHQIQKPTAVNIKVFKFIEYSFDALFTKGAMLISTNFEYINSPLLILTNQTDVFAFSVDIQSNQADSHLNLIAKLENIGHGINFIKIKDGLIFIGDSVTGVTVIDYDFVTRKFSILSKENGNRNVTALKASLYHSICGGDAYGNVFQFSVPSSLITASKSKGTSTPKASEALKISLNYNVGDIVTGVDFTNDLFHCIWYSTISGGFGGIIRFSDNILVAESLKEASSEWIKMLSKKLSLLKIIEQKVAWNFASMTNGNAFEFHNKQFPSSGVIDLDIVEMFFLLSEKKQKKIIDDIRAKSNFPDSIEHFGEILNQFKNYFWNWSNKK